MKLTKEKKLKILLTGKPVLMSRTNRTIYPHSYEIWTVDTKDKRIFHDFLGRDDTNILNESVYTRDIENLTGTSWTYVDWFQNDIACSHDEWDYEILRGRNCPCYA